jgi:Cu(I)/Ag(I) efflux system membrane protein CusA/SilA
MVDASIIIIENIHKRLDDWEREGKPGERFDVIVHAMQEVGPSIFFSLLVITVSFIPVFTLEATGAGCSSRSRTPRRTRWASPPCSP